MNAPVPGSAMQLVAASVAALLIAGSALAQGRGEFRREGRFQQDGGGGGGFRGGMGGGEGFRGGMGEGGPGGGQQWGGNQPGGGQNMTDRLDMLRRLDINGNGMVDPNELEGRQRFMVERLAQQAGLDMSRPIPIDKLTAAMEERMRQRQQEGQQPQQQQQRPGDNKQSPQNSKTAAAKPIERLVPGFGEPSDLIPVPGFGMAVAIVSKPTESRPVEKSANEKAGNENRGGENRDARRNEGSSETPSGDRGNQQNNQGPGEGRRALADGMLKQYDENGNGQLEKSEWSKNPDLARYDANGDGTLTRDELVEGLRNWRPGQGNPGQGNSDSGEQGGRGARFGGGQGGGDQGGGGQGGWGGRMGRRGQEGGTAPGGGLAKASSTGTQVARYLDPTQRLPEGLPGWFIRADTNGDGQIEMHEFASQWSESEITRFNKYDLNGDGILTPDEVLQIEKPAAKTASPPAAKGPAAPEAAAPAAKSPS